MNNLALIIMLIEYNNDKVEWHCVTNVHGRLALQLFVLCIKLNVSEC